MTSSLMATLGINPEKSSFKPAAFNSALTEANDPDFDSLFEEKEDVVNETALHNRYHFYCLKRSKGATNYEEGVKRIGSFQTIEHFWRLYDHIVRPNDHKTTIDYHMFKNGIKPTWEDPNNEHGGKWMVRLKKGLASLYWEELVLAIIGEQFDVGNEVCGAVVSVRGTEDIISVWNKTADNTEATERIRDKMRAILNLPNFVPMEYKKHHDSLSDKSSFRNTIIWRAPKGEGKSRQNYGGRGGAHGDKEYRERGTSLNRDSKPVWAGKQARQPSGEDTGSALPSAASWGKYHREESSNSSSGWVRGRGVDGEDGGQSKSSQPRTIPGMPGVLAPSRDGDGVSRPVPATTGSRYSETAKRQGSVENVWSRNAKQEE